MTNADSAASERRSRRGGGGAEARRAARSGVPARQLTYIKRNIPIYEVLSEEGLSLIEANAETVLQEIGIDFRDDAEALDMWKHGRAPTSRATGCASPRDWCGRSSRRRRANSPNMRATRSGSVIVGGKNTVFAPVYGPPFVRNLDEGPALCDDRGFPQFREARLHVAVAASFGRHGVRAGRRPGGQAPSRHGLQPHPLFRQAVHGIGHGAERARGFGHHGEDGVRRRIRRPELRD